MRALFLLLYICIAIATLSAQKNTPLTLGQQMKSFQVKDMNGQSISFEQFEGKLVILDFFHSQCVPCIQAFPKLDSLQKKYNDRVKILLITTETKDHLFTALKKYKIQLPTLTTIVNDTLFNDYFPHQSIPHHVWIDFNKKVRYITGGYNTNDQNVQAFLSGQSPKLAYKNDLPDFDRSVPLLFEGGGRLQPYIESYSILMPKLDLISGNMFGFKKDSIQKTATLRVINNSILSLFQIAFGNNIFAGEFDFANRVKLEVRNPGKLKRPENPVDYDAWAKENIFSYECRMPLDKQQQVYKKMQTDLNTFLDYSASVQRRIVPCLVLIVKNGVHQQTSINTIQPSKSSYVIHQQSVAKFVQAISFANADLDTPVVDGTHLTNPISLQLNSKLDDIPTLKTELNRYGFDLVLQNVEIDMLVIQDK